MKKFLLLLLYVSFSFSSFAQAKFYAKGATKTSTSSKYRVIFTLENAKGSKFKPPSFDGFRILSGPNQSSSYQWVNGKTTRSISYYYDLQALEVGELTIGEASIVVDNKTLTSNSIKVEVVEGQNQPHANTPHQQQQQNPAQMPATTSDNWKKQAKDNLFVKVYASKKSPYVGEQVFLYAKLYQRINTYGAQVIDVPKMNGFWKQQIDVNTDDWKVEEFNGKQYNTLIISKWAIFPLKEGNFTINPLKINAILMVSEPTTESFFGFQVQRMNYKQVDYNFSSNAFSIDVKPLPTAGKPNNFSGAVGKFSMQTNLDSNTLDVGDAASLNIKISGKGNIMSFTDPEPSFPKGFELYDPQIEEKISKQSNFIQGNKHYTYLMVANTPGDFVIPPVTFSYFDLESNSYETLHSDSITIHVEGEAIQAQNIPNTTRTIEKDIRYIHLKNDVQKKNNSFFGSAKFWVSTLSPIILFVFLVIGMRYKEKKVKDIVSLKRKKAQKEAVKRLKLAKTYLDKNEKKAFYTEIFAVLNGYVQDKFNIAQADLNKDLIVEEFSEKNIPESLTNEFIKILENTELALYSPNSVSKMNEDYTHTKTCIENIENELV